MKAAKRTFRPPLWASIGGVIACAAFVAAGFWQLDRAEQKRILFREFDAGHGPAPLTMPVDDADADALRYQPLRLAGRYDIKHQVLLDNMIRQGEPGYQVLTPLRGDGFSVLVNRGWLPAGADRNRLPDITVADIPRIVTGRIAPLPRPGFDLGAGSPASDEPWPRRRQFPTAAALGDELGYPVRSYQMLLDADAPDGYVREWRPDVMSPEKHISYAVQWFGFAVLLIIIYFVVNWQPTAGERS